MLSSGTLHIIGAYQRLHWSQHNQIELESSYKGIANGTVRFFIFFINGAGSQLGYVWSYQPLQLRASFIWLFFPIYFCQEQIYLWQETFLCIPSHLRRRLPGKVSQPSIVGLYVSQRNRSSSNEKQRRRKSFCGRGEAKVGEWPNEKGRRLIKRKRRLEKQKIKLRKSLAAGEIATSSNILMTTL